MQWICSVHQHRPNWLPTSNKATPSSILFHSSNFTIETDAIPSIEVANYHMVSFTKEMILYHIEEAK